MRRVASRGGWALLRRTQGRRAGEAAEAGRELPAAPPAAGPREGAGASGSGGAGAPRRDARLKGARGRAGALTAPGDKSLEILVMGKGKSEKSLDFFFFFFF